MDGNSTLIVVATITAIPAALGVAVSFSNKKHIGRSNGKGTLVAMAEDNIRWQERHAKDDHDRFEEIRDILAKQDAAARDVREHLVTDAAQVKVEK